MKILIAGGTGFLGRRLIAALAADGHAAAALPRGSVDGVDGADVVVNLSGESIAAHRWSAAQKQRILDSRVDTTRHLVDAVRASSRPPRAFVSGSAVGYYGPRGDELVTESVEPGDDFLARVCVAWEHEASRASDITRVVRIRTGLVLARDGGALPKMLPPFRLGVGGPVGSGRQYWPWIHVSDWVALVRWAIQDDTVVGPVNATAPEPVTNRTFASALGRAMRRPALLPAPSVALRVLLGEMADALLLSGQRAIPHAALGRGFRFRYSSVDDALRALFA